MWNSEGENKNDRGIELEGRAYLTYPRDITLFPDFPVLG